MKRSNARRTYGPDLASIHHAGFTEFSGRAAPGLLSILRANGVARGRVVELGCGSGGLLVFDALLPGPRSVVTRAWSEGKGWAVLVETRASSRALIRRIVSHRWMASRFRRSEEVHRLRLYPAARLEAWLKGAGFRVRVARGYGRFRLPGGNRMVFIVTRRGTSR